MLILLSFSHVYRCCISNPNHSEGSDAPIHLRHYLSGNFNVLKKCHDVTVATKESFCGAKARKQMDIKDDTDLTTSGARVAALEKPLDLKRTSRNLAVLGLLAAPWVSFLAIALKPSPRQMWAQRWPTISFVGLYRLALDRCVEIHGLEHLPSTGPVILAGNHI